MLNLTKHMHPDKTVINVTFVMLKRMRAKKIMSFTELLAYTKSNGLSEPLFLPAIHLLYILGLIDYQKKNDNFIYTGK